MDGLDELPVLKKSGTGEYEAVYEKDGELPVLKKNSQNSQPPVGGSPQHFEDGGTGSVSAPQSTLGTEPFDPSKLSEAPQPPKVDIAISKPDTLTASQKRERLNSLLPKLEKDYKEKAAIEPPTKQPIVEDQSFMGSVTNTVSNIGTSLEGVIPRYRVFAADVGEKIFGKDILKGWYMYEGLEAPEKIRSDSYAKLAKLDNEVKQTQGIYENLKNGNAKGLAAGVVDAVGQVVSTAVPTVLTAGAGLVSETVGRSIVDYNNAKAEAKGITVDELYKSGQADFNTPVAIGTVATALEGLGLKGMGNALSRNITKKGIKNAALIMWDVNQEGLTEWVQLGLETANIGKAQGLTDEQIADNVAKSLFSEQGVETYLKGSFGSGAVVGAGKVFQSINNPKRSEEVQTLETKRAEAIADLSNPNVSPETKDALIDVVYQAGEDIDAKVNEDIAEYQELSDEGKKELDNTISQIDARKQIISDPNISEATKKTAEEEIKTLYEKAYTVIKDGKKAKEEITPKTTQDAVQEQKPAEMDVRQQAEDGKKMGEGNQADKAVAEQGKAESQKADIERRRQEISDKVVVSTLSGSRTITQLESELGKKYEFLDLGDGLVAFTTTPEGTVTTYHVADTNNALNDGSVAAYSIYKNAKGEVKSANKANIELVSKANNQDFNKVFLRLEDAKSRIAKYDAEIAALEKEDKTKTDEKTQEANIPQAESSVNESIKQKIKTDFGAEVTFTKDGFEVKADNKVIQAEAEDAVEAMLKETKVEVSEQVAEESKLKSESEPAPVKEETPTAVIEEDKKIGDKSNYKGEEVEIIKSYPQDSYDKKSGYKLYRIKYPNGKEADVSAQKLQAKYPKSKGIEPDTPLINLKNTNEESYYEGVSFNEKGEPVVEVAYIFNDGKKRQDTLYVPYDKFDELYRPVTKSQRTKIKSELKQAEKNEPVKLGGLTETEKAQKAKATEDIINKNLTKFAKDENATDSKGQTSDTENSPSDKKQTVKRVRAGNRVPKVRRKIKNPRAIEALKKEVSDPRSRVLKYFIGGGTISDAAIEQLFGVKNNPEKTKTKTAEEKRRRIGIRNNKTGLDIDGLAHFLWETKEDWDERFDTSDFRDAVEEVVLNHNGTGSMIDELLETKTAEEDYYSQTYGETDIETEFIDEAEDMWESLSEEQKEAIINEQADIEALHDEYEAKQYEPEKSIEQVKAEKEYADKLSDIEKRLTEAKKAKENKLNKINKGIDIFADEAKRNELFGEKQDLSKENIDKQLKSETEAIAKIEKEKSDFVVNKEKFLKKYEGQTNIEDAAKKLATKIREGKLNKKGNLGVNTPASIAVDLAIETAAQIVEKGGSAAQAIADGIKQLRDSEAWKNASERVRKAMEEMFSETVEAKAKEFEKENPPTEPKEENEEGEPEKKNKRYEQRELEEYKDDVKLLEAVKSKGLQYEPVAWKKVNPLADDILAEAIADPEKADENISAIAEKIAKTTVEDYRNNPLLSTLHSLLAAKVIAHYRAQENYEKFTEWSNGFSNDARYKGQFISAMQADSSPESIANRIIKDFIADKDSKLTEELKAEIKDLQDRLKLTEEEIAILQKAVEDLGQKQTTEPTVSEEDLTPSQQIKLKRQKGFDKISKALKRQRGQMNNVINLFADAELLSGIKEVIESYIEEGAYKAKTIKAKLLKEIGDKELRQAIEENWDKIYDNTLQGKALEKKKEAFVKKLEERAKSNAKNKKSKVPDAETVLLNTLLSKVNETVKPEQKSKRTPIEEIAEGIKNNTFSDEVWQKAMANVKLWLAAQTDISQEKRAEILAKLQDSVADFMKKPFAESHLRKAIAEGAKDLGIEIAKVVKEHWIKQNFAHKTLAEKLIEKLGLTEAQANQYQERINQEVRKIFEEKKLSEIKKALGLDADGKPKTTKEKQARRIIDKIMEGINMGVLTNPAFQNYFAEKYNFTHLDNEAVQKLQMFNDLINSHHGNEVSRKYMKDLMDYVETLKPFNAYMFYNALQSLTVKGMLTGLNTITVNIPIGSYLSYFANTIPRFIANPVAYNEARKAFNSSGLSGVGRKSFIDIIRNGYNILDEGAKQLEERDDTHGDIVDYWINNYNPKEFAKAVKKAKTPQQKAALVLGATARTYIQVLQIANFARAFDVLINHRGAEVEYFMREYNQQLKDAGKGFISRFNPLIAKQVADKVKQKMAYDKLSEISADVDVELADMKARGESVGMGLRQRLIKQRMEEYRDREKVKLALDYVKSSTLMEAPVGLGGRVYQGIMEKLAIKQTEDYAFGFLKTTLRTGLGLFLRISITSGQRIIESVPIIGLAPPGIIWEYKEVPKDPTKPNGVKVWKPVWQESRKRNQRLMLHAASAGVMTLAAMAMFDWDDDEEKLVLDPDRWIDITGIGTGEIYGNDQLNSKNPDGSDRERQDYSISIKINDKWQPIFPARLIPHLVPTIAILGGMRDEATLHQKEKKKKKVVEQFTSHFGDIILATTEQSFAQLPKLAETTISATKKEGIAGGGAVFLTQTTSPLRTAIYANMYQDIYNEVGAINQDTVKTKRGAAGSFLKNVPVLEDMILVAQTDAFGYPIKRTSKVIGAVKNNPLTNLIIDNANDFENINRERYEQPAWKLKNQYHPDFLIEAYWAKGKPYEMQQLGVKSYGEAMREIWETNAELIKTTSTDRLLETQTDLTNRNANGNEKVYYPQWHDLASAYAKYKIAEAEKGDLEKLLKNMEVDERKFVKKKIQSTL